MSIEIPGADEKISKAAAEASIAGARAICVEGVEAGRAFTYGSRAATHSGEILLIALREMGLLNVEAIDTNVLRREIAKVEEEAGITREMQRLKFEEERFLSGR